MSLLFLRALLHVTSRLPLRRDESGQTTAEYALVIIGAAALAALLLAWATKSGAISKLFESVISHVIPK
jgi:Flp pilus assembly pilin Flp